MAVHIRYPAFLLIVLVGFTSIKSVAMSTYKIAVLEDTECQGPSALIRSKGACALQCENHESATGDVCRGFSYNDNTCKLCTDILQTSGVDTTMYLKVDPIEGGYDPKLRAEVWITKSIVGEFGKIGSIMQITYLI